MAGAGRCFVVPGGDESSESDTDFVWDKDEQVPQKNKHFRDLSQTDDKYDTLKTALVSGNLMVIEELLDSGVNVESTFSFGWTPLMYAASVANVELMRILLERGANASFDKDQYTVLMAACSARVPEEQILNSVELLLSRNANPNAACRKKMTPLMYAARNGLLQVVALLVAHGSEINIQDERGYTALMWAAHQGHKKVVIKLLELGADRSIQTKDGQTSGEIAKNKNHPELFSLLCLSKNPFQGRLKDQSREDFIHRLLKPAPDSIKTHKSSSYAAFGDLEVFLHGLELEHITEILKERGITLRELLTMTKEDFIQIGIKNTRDQQKIIDVAKDMQVEDLKLGELPCVTNVEFSGDEFLAFLLKLNKQCIHLRAAVQSIAEHFPTDAQKLVLQWNSFQSLSKVCEDLVFSTEDLNGEANKLKLLTQKLHGEQKDDPCQIQPRVKTDPWQRTFFKLAVVTLIGAGCVDFVIKLIQRKN